MNPCHASMNNVLHRSAEPHQAVHCNQAVQVLHTHVSLGSGGCGAASPLDSTILHFMPPSRCHMLFDISRKGSALLEQASQFCRSTPCAATISAPKASVLIVCSRFTAASLAGSMCPGRYLVVALASNRCRRTHQNYFVGAGHGLPTPW